VTIPHRIAKTYIRIVPDSAAFFHRPPDTPWAGTHPPYQAHLFQSKKWSTASVSQYVSALGFLYDKTLRRHFLTEHIPQIAPTAARRARDWYQICVVFSGF